MKISSSYRMSLLLLALITTIPQLSYANLEYILDVDKDFSEELNKDCPDSDTIKVRQKIYALRSAKFFKDVEFKDDVEIEGTLTAAEEVVGCDLTVGCNINMQDSASGLIGNVVKDGVSFINNFGTNNTFVGKNAGNFTMTGINNSGFGFNALAANTSGLTNTAFGSLALQNNLTGTGNTAVGAGAAPVNTTGNLNTAIGDAALFQNASGSNNVAIGSNTGSLLVSGSSNIYISNVGGGAAESFTIRIGTLGTQTDAYIQGIFGAAVAGGGLPVEVDALGKLGTVVSSAEFKKNIQDMDLQSEKLRRLRPVTFEYKSDDSNTQQMGLIAEEVAQVFPELVVYDLEGQPYSVRYQALPVLLLQELQRHQDLINDLTARISQLEDLLNAAA